jgi:hypothetical protein
MRPLFLEYKFGARLAVFEVDLPSRSPIYMSFELHEHMGEHSAVAFVDAGRFLELWRNEPYPIHSEQSFGNPNIWRADRKFHFAEKGFAEGRTNPVPLAYVSFGLDERVVEFYRFLWFGRSESKVKVPYVGFTNGITRTIWLLANGCRSFPIECELPRAQDLVQYAGTQGATLQTVESLLKLPTEA